MKENKREQAVRLRRAGYSYSYIVNATGLSKSTVSYHVSKVPYEPNRHTRLHIRKATVATARTQAGKRFASIARANHIAKLDVGALTKRDMFMLGIGVYIGEGSKTGEIVRMVNTDYRVINLFIKWLKQFGLTNSNFVIRLHLYPDSQVNKAETYWHNMTKLPKSQFQPVYIDSREGRATKRGIHPNGTAHVTVRANGNKEFGVDLSRRISAWMEEVLK